MIETERLRLRDWREDDIDPFIRHTNTEPVMRWLGGVKSADEHRGIIHDPAVFRAISPLRHRVSL